MTDKEAKRVAWMCSWYFDDDDWSANPETIKKYDLLAELDTETGEIISFVLVEENETYLRGKRSGVLRRCRGKGLGVKMFKRMSQLAKKRGKEYKTYSSLTNVRSLNAHFAAGMTIEKVDPPDESGFISVHLTTRHFK